MKKITQEELKKVLDDHVLWWESDGDEGQKADLSYMDLSHRDLSCINLSYANLFHADLSDADLSYADLSNTDLSNANLFDTSLAHVELTGANLSNTNLIDTDLSYANLIDTNLTYADLSCAYLFHADLSNANLFGAKLTKTIVQNVTGKKVIAVQVDTSRDNNLISYWIDLDIWTTGWFQGTLEELKKSIEENHKYDLFLKNRYFKIIDFILNIAEEDKKKDEKL